MKRHQPRHIYADNQLYFLTAHLFDREFRLEDGFRKDKLLLKIFSFAWEEKIELRAWAILHNHYHLLVNVRNGDRLPEYVSKIHRGYTFEMNQTEGRKGRRLWMNYWDWCIRDEADYWRHFNYIHNNPIKHGIVHDKDALKAYRYGSYWNYVRTHGEKWLLDAMAAYPVLDFTTRDDE